jgi:hypothetical protein
MTAMTTIPPGLGNSLLILMSDTPASLAMIRNVLRQLADPPRARITLAHYLEPLLWRTADLKTILAWQEWFEQQDDLLNVSQPDPDLPSYFDRARGTLVQTGIVPEQIHVDMVWHNLDTINMRLAHLGRGDYSGVVIVRHHYDLLFNLLGSTLRQMLEPYGHQITLWVFGGPNDSAKKGP